MRKFEAIYPNGKRVTQFVRGVCQFDVLNPCWNARPTDVPGKHWSGMGDACEACTKAARKPNAPAVHTVAA